MKRDYINDPTDPAYPLGEPARDPEDIEEEIAWREERGEFANDQDFEDDATDGELSDRMHDVEFEDRIGGTGYEDF